MISFDFSNIKTHLLLTANDPASSLIATVAGFLSGPPDLLCIIVCKFIFFQGIWREEGDLIVKKFREKFRPKIEKGRERRISVN